MAIARIRAVNDKRTLRATLRNPENHRYASRYMTGGFFSGATAREADTALMLARSLSPIASAWALFELKSLAPPDAEEIGEYLYRRDRDTA